MKIFFAHPIKTYATPESLEVLKALKEEYPGSTIIDPENYDIPEARSCEHCRIDIMGGLVFTLVEECQIFALWVPIATCEVECALHHAWHNRIPCIYVSYQHGEVDFEYLTLEDYHKIESQTPTEEIL